MTVMLIFLWCGPLFAQTALKTGDPFPRFTLPDFNQSVYTLPDDARGKVLIIHFWASWCPLCVREMNAIEAIRTEYAEKGMAVFSINVGDTVDAARAYVKNTRAAYPILLDSKTEVAKQRGVNSIPTTFVCDRNGVIRFKILGEVSKIGMEKLLSILP